MTAYPLNLKPGGIIPPDINMGVMLRKKVVGVAVAAAIAATPVVAATCPGDFVRAEFNGAAAVSLLDYVPDCGKPFLDADVNADDAIFYNIESAALLVLDGTGGLALDASVATQVPYRQFALKLGTQPASADYYVEIGIQKLPDDVIVGLIAARAKPMESGGWANAIQSVGMQFQNHFFEDPGGLQINDQTAIDGGTSGGNVFSDYDNYEGPNTYGFIYRLEVKGMTKTFKLNGVTVFEDTITDARFADPGEIYIFLDYIRRDDPPYVLTSPLVTHIRAGYLPAP